MSHAGLAEVLWVGQKDRSERLVRDTHRVATWQAGDRWDPRNPENRDRTRGLQRDLRSLLMRWDPIGVGDAPGFWNEYDAYISPLMHQLHRGDSPEEITRYLSSVVEDDIGIPAHPVRERAFAAELIDWWSRATRA